MQWRSPDNSVVARQQRSHRKVTQSNDGKFPAQTQKDPTILFRKWLGLAIGLGARDPSRGDRRFVSALGLNLRDSRTGFVAPQQR